MDIQIHPKTTGHQLPHHGMRRGTHNSSTYRSAPSRMGRLDSRAAIPMNLRYRHQEREFVASPPQIPLLEFRVLALPLPSPKFLPFLLPPPPPLSLSRGAHPRGLFQDVNGRVLARMGRGVTVVSVHWSLHAIAIGQERRVYTSQERTSAGFLGDMIHNQTLDTRYCRPQHAHLEGAPTVHVGHTKLSLHGVQLMGGRFRWKVMSIKLTRQALHVISSPFARLVSSTWSSLGGGE